MTTLEIILPENINFTHLDLKMSMASKLFEQGRISSGQGAAIVGVSKREFIEMLGKYDVSIFGYDESELEKDVEKCSKI